MTQIKSTLIITIISLFFNLEGFSQAYLDDLAKQSCECFESIPKQKDANSFNMEFGLCMLKAAKPYEKKLRKDHGIDLSNLASEGHSMGEKLGALIGMNMMSYCPDAMMEIAKTTQEDNKEVIEVDAVVSGTVNDIGNDTFISFSIKSENGISAKYYWLTPIKTDINLPVDYEKLINNNITVTYTEMDMYDDRIKEYRPFKIITSLKKID